MNDDDLPISYQAAVRGTPVLSSSGATIGTLEHVLEVPEVDVFDGIVIATDGGLRFIDADQVLQITRSRIRSTVDDAQASQLPPPDGPPVYRVDALAEEIRLMLDVGVVAGPGDIDLCMILGAGWPFLLGGITPYLDRAGISEKVTGTRFHL